MRYSRKHQEETYRRILRSVGRGFRSKGFGGIGIDGLAKGAAVTSGAFYGHFRSKADAFRGALVAGIDEFRQWITALQAEHGDGWLDVVAELYFTERVTCDLADGCALSSLTGEVARGDAKTKATFEKSYLELVEALANGLPGERPDAEARAIVMTALFVGGVSVARAVRRSEHRDRIARILRDAVVAVARGGA
jgi:TetR/AcrR family transcriptional regulator, transcriptional repressor for nem operon